MKLAPFVLLFLLVVSPLPARAGDRSIRTVLVVPDGETLTVEEYTLAVQAVKDAAAFWERVHPGKPHLPVLDSAYILQVPADGFVNFTWANGWRVDDPLTVFIVDNSTSGKLFGQMHAFTLEEVFTVIQGTTGTSSLPATIAHELGHARFGVHDLYPPFTPYAYYDIMGDSLRAYRDGILGLTTMESMGYPSKRYYVPLM